MLNMHKIDHCNYFMLSRELVSYGKNVWKSLILMKESSSNI